ncbi:MAG: OmpA family protein [Hydrogenophilales bacterium]|nr:OmpA family protein [Hydrogenophilales bacterium]
MQSSLRPLDRPPSLKLLLPALIAAMLGGCATQEYVQQETGQYNQRIVELEAWMNATSLGIETNAKRILNAENRLDGAERQGAAVATRLDGTRGDVAENGRRLERLAAELSAMRQRVESDAAEAGRFRQKLDEVEARLNATGRRLEGSVAGLAMAEARIRALESRVASPRKLDEAGPASTGVAPMAGDAPTASLAGAPASEPAAAVVVAPVVAPTPEQAPAPTTPPGVPSPVAPAPAATGAAEPATADFGRLLARQGDDLASTRGRLATVETGLADLQRRDKDQAETLEGANRKLDALQSELGRVGHKAGSNADAIARIDAQMDAARKRVEASEKGLAESGLRLTMVQELLDDQGARLSKTELESGKLSASAAEALERAMAAGRLAEGKLIHETTFSEEVAMFGFQDAKLNDGARQRLADFANRLKAENKGVFIEIQGHTDDVGPAAVNMDLSLARARSVRDYLHQEAGIPLHRLAVAPYGETRPVADNKTREGRLKNRRVVLVVLK